MVFLMLVNLMVVFIRIFQGLRTYSVLDLSVWPVMAAMAELLTLLSYFLQMLGPRSVRLFSDNGVRRRSLLIVRANFNEYYQK